MARFVLAVMLVTAALLLPGPQLGHGTGGAGGEPPDAGERPGDRLVFLTHGNRLTSVDVETGKRAERRVSVAACGPELYVTGGHVVFAELRRRRTVVYSVPIALDRRPRRLGSAHAFVPSAADGRVWLAGVDCHRRGMAGVKEVNVDGQVTLESRRRVPAAWLVGAVEGGLVLQLRRSVSVWDPSTGASRGVPGIEMATATSGNSIAGCAPRARCRSLVIVDAETGGTVVVRPSGPYHLDPGAEFSPDGALLALPVVAHRRWSVALVDTSDGTIAIVPGSRIGRYYPELRWSASSGWLYFRAPGGRVMAYRPGRARAVALPFHLPKQAVALLAG